MKTAAWLLLVGAAACAQVPPRQAAPLRYDVDPAVANVAVDEALREKPPMGAPEPPLRCGALRTAVLSNGVHLVVAERHAFPAVAVRLVFPTRVSLWDEGGAARMELMGATFLSPSEVGSDASARCTHYACTLGALGLSSKVDSLLGSLAVLVVSPREPRDAYVRRLASSVASWKTSPRLSNRVFARNATAAVFGDAPFADLADAEYRLEDIERTRDAVLRPESATLVIAGDVSFEAARAASERWFAAWSGRGPPSSPPVPVRDQGRGHGVVLVDVSGMARPLGAVLARGPSRADPDAVALAVAAQLLGGGLTSAAFRSVREEMSAAYSVGGDIEWLPGTSVFTLAGQFEPEKTVDALVGLLGSIRRLRRGTSEDDLERGKAALVARIRRSASASSSIADSVAGALLAGGPLDPCELAPQVEAVSARDVVRVANAYLAEDRLHVVAVGPGAKIAPTLSQLGLGAEHRHDVLGRDLAPPGARAAEE